MKKIVRVFSVCIATIILLGSMTLTTFADKETRNNLKGCTVYGCHHTRKGDSFYCSEHKCAIYDCPRQRAYGDKYCSVHKGSSAKKTVVNGKVVKDTGTTSSAKGYTGSTGRKKTTYKDSYDEGYEDIWLDDDYDWDRYYSDDDYASGVDDAMEDVDW